MGPVADGRPLPLRPAGSVEITPAVHLLKTEEAGAVFLDGMASWCWEPTDVVGRRLAAVQLTKTKTALPGAIYRPSLCPPTCDDQSCERLMCDVASQASEPCWTRRVRATVSTMGRSQRGR